MNSNIKKILVALIAVLVIGVSTCALLYFGIIHINHPELSGYNIRGVDVSSYQGDIDWDVLSSQDIDFAYIKATEGSSTVDRCFEANWQGASKTDLRIGAYHFFSFESSGEKQAKLFCDTVNAVPDMLPPVIDVEFYGGFHNAGDIDVDAVKKELRSMVDILTEHYGVKPIIYVRSETYASIVKGDFADCGIWYRSVYKKVSKDVEWTIWQYSNRHVLKGYNGSERYVDMNVFKDDKYAK
ncbi:MAG: glycoside hydrolase family 25 [Lachnospiraceae bacterium]|nr:glycoside hydrolase family 25 [Lachnospiraceae bacterium]